MGGSLCNPLQCPVYSAGWCEYDFAFGVLMPINPDICPELKKEASENENHTS